MLAQPPNKNEAKSSGRIISCAVNFDFTALTGSRAMRWAKMAGGEFFTDGASLIGNEAVQTAADSGAAFGKSTTGCATWLV